MQIRHLARFVCAATAALFLSQSGAIAVQPDSGIGRSAPSATVDADRVQARVKLAQAMRGPGSGSASPRKGTRSRSGSRGRRGGRGGRHAFGGTRRYRGGSFVGPLSPFVYGFSSPYFYDDYPSSGRCAYWHRRCVASWGYGNDNYYGCMRYYGCR